MRNLHRRFDRYYIIYGGDFAKICDLLRLYELKSFTNYIFFHRRMTPSRRPTLADNNVRIEIVSSIKKKKIVPSQPEDDIRNEQVKKTPKTNLISVASNDAKGPIDIISVSGHSLSAMSPASTTSNLSLELEKDATEP